MLPWLRTAALCILLGGTVPAAWAGNFAVSPVRVNLSAQSPAAALTLSNAADAPLTVQATAVAWQQEDGQDTYVDTADLIISPPLFEVPPRASQIVRIGLRGKMPTDGERSYRLLLREIPSPPPPGFAGVQVALQMSLPVFVQPEAATFPKLDWFARADSGKVVLRIANRGNVHVQITALRVALERSRVVYNQPLSLYLLPGSERSVEIPVPGEAINLSQPLSVHAKTDAGPDINTTIVFRQ